MKEDTIMKNEMKFLEEATIEVVKFDSSDVIATSGPVTYEQVNDNLEEIEI